MDPLSDILSILKPKSLLAAVLDLGDPWAIRFPDQQGGLKCNAIISGKAWVTVDEGGPPVLIHEGDFFLLPTGSSFVVASDPSIQPVRAEEIVNRGGNALLTTVNGGGDTVILSSRFTLANQQAARLIALLPPVVLVRSQTEEAMRLRQFVGLIVDELRRPRPGGTLIAQHLSHLMLVHTIRLYQAEGGRALGWLSALEDPRLGAAIKIMHEDPAHKWTLQSLADRAGMSRSVFARKFHEVVGQTPIEYLSYWRMLLAQERLVSSNNTISSVATSLGYESESAFSTAFKRIMGVSPRRYARQLGHAMPALFGSETGAI